MPETIEKTKIVRTPGTVGGKARLKGTRMSVLHIVESKEFGMSVDEMTKAYNLTRTEIETALEYYEENKKEIEKERKRGEKIDKELRKDALTLKDITG